MKLKNPTVFVDITDTAERIKSTMYHTQKLLEAAAESGSHVPVQSLMIVCGASCAFVAGEADSILSNTATERFQS